MSRKYRALARDRYSPAVVAGYPPLAPGGVMDIDSDAAAHGHQFIFPMLVGTTAQRPKEGEADLPGGRLKEGTLYLDTSLSLVVVYTGGDKWRNPVDGSTQ